MLYFLLLHTSIKLFAQLTDFLRTGCDTAFGVRDRMVIVKTIFQNRVIIIVSSACTCLNVQYWFPSFNSNAFASTFTRRFAFDIF
jgi:hypothetical protein